MRCRYVNKIFLSEENGFTVAVYSTSDESVPLSARNKYLESRNIIGFTAVGYNLPLTDTIELEIQNGCKKLYEGCRSLSLPVQRMIWDMNEKGEWCGRIKGIDDFYYATRRNTAK